MTFNVEVVMMYLSYLLIGIGALAFLVSVVVEVIKDLPWLIKLPTSAVTLVASIVVCMIAMLVACQHLKMIITWYYFFAAFAIAFIVYLVSTGGWDRVTAIWKRVKYDKNGVKK